MNRILLFFTTVVVCLSSMSYVTVAQAPPIEWQKTIGGSGDDRLLSIIQTADSGYAALGYSKSGISGDKTEAGRGDHDYWIVKLNAHGVLQWQKAYGGQHEDVPYSIIQTTDGGYFVVGNSTSGITGDKSEPNRGVIGDIAVGRDYWLLRLDATGNLLWQKTYGGYGTDMPYAAMQRKNGGFIVAGISDWVPPPSGNYPIRDRNTANYGWNDYWLLKLDATGSIQSQQAHGGSRHDNLFSLIPTLDGGYIGGALTGSATGTGTRVGALNGGYDSWIVKMDSSFTEQWQIAMGGTQDDWGIGGGDPYGNSGEGGMEQTADSGYLVGNSSMSGATGNKTVASFGSWDWWIVQLDKHGAMVWQKELGGSSDDRMATVMQTADLGIFAAGTSNSPISGNKTVASKGNNDFWLVKMDQAQNIQWQTALGGSDDDQLTVARRTTDGGYILGGFSKSNVSGDKTEPSRGDYDFWIVKLRNCDLTTYDTVSICKGDTYLRRNGTLTSQPGIYRDTISNSQGCDTIIVTNLLLLSDTTHLRTDHLLGPDTLLCTGQQLNLQVSFPGATKYVWSTGAASPSIIVTQANSYWVDVTQPNGCITRDTVRVTYTPTPVVDLGGNRSICKSALPLVLRSPQPAGYVYLWSNGISDSVLEVWRTDTYWLQVTNGRCVRTDTIFVNVVEEPEVSIGPDTTICAQMPVRIGTEIPRAGYRWNTGANTAYIFADSTRTYILEVNIEGCLLYDSVHITAMPEPEPDLGDDQNICAQQTIQLNGTTPDGQKYLWNTGDTTKTYNATRAGSYWVNVTSGYGCTGADTIVLGYLPKPTLFLGEDTVVCEETPLILKPSLVINEDKMSWSNGDTNYHIYIREAGIYIASAVNQCGATSDTISVRQIFCDIWMPNAFTPNGDGVNDVLRILGNTSRVQGFEMSIYNRWGEQVFISRDKYKGWNGEHKGRPAPMGTFVYMFQYNIDGKPVFQKGNITLIR